MSAQYLSKSRIIAGRQCEKRLWLEAHRPELIEYDDNVKQRFNTGNMVNDVARSQFPGGVLIEYERGTAEALKETRRLLAQQPATPIFEAAFKTDGVLVRTDILRKKRGHFELIEVKSSTEVEPVHVEDCAVQAWVLEKAGLPLKETTLCHINNQFIYRGNNDYEGLFAHVPMTKEIRALKTEVGKWVKRFKRVLAGGEPKTDVGSHCKEPYECPFIDHCSGPQSEYPVDCLPGSGKAKIIAALKAEGIRDLREIPAGRLSNKQHEWVRKVTQSGKAELRPGAKQAISSLAYPRYYLDFETASFAVPIWEGTRPYQSLPFQWSCHIQTSPRQMRHEEFIDCTGQPPMRGLTESLLKTLGTQGPIFVYSGYEKRMLNQLAGLYPDLEARINKVIKRLVDLLPIARENYYHPDMLGSWSIKYIIPTVTEAVDYHSGDIQDGGSAQTAYQQMLSPAMTSSDREKLRQALLDYCKLDTLATVELVKLFSTGKTNKNRG
jgi:hypothetical protein